MMADKINYLEHDRFEGIYLLSLILPSWSVIGWKLDGVAVTKEEFEFVLDKTRKEKGGEEW